MTVLVVCTEQLRVFSLADRSTMFVVLKSDFVLFLCVCVCVCLICLFFPPVYKVVVRWNSSMDQPTCYLKDESLLFSSFRWGGGVGEFKVF